MRQRTKIAAWGWIWTLALPIATAGLVLLASIPVASAGASTPRPSDVITILAFGDSLTAGLGLPPDKSFPAQLQSALLAKGYHVRVENSGVSGETAEDALARLDWSLSGKPDAAIIELGGNDVLRGIAPKIAEAALDRILAKFKERGIPVLLTGMEAPRNWGPDYDAAFRAIYPRLKAKYGVLLYPFFLKDVAAVPALNQADGIHPTAEGVSIIVRDILPLVEKLIEEAEKKRAGSAG